MNIYLGNLSYSATENSIRDLFEGYGSVTTVKIVTDKFTGSSRGFGFVEMANDDEAQKAIAEINGKELDGRALTVNEARPMEPRAPRTGGGFGGGSRGGFGGGNRY